MGMGMLEHYELGDGLRPKLTPFALSRATPVHPPTIAFRILNDAQHHPPAEEDTKLLRMSSKTNEVLDTQKNRSGARTLMQQPR